MGNILGTAAAGDSHVRFFRRCRSAERRSLRRSARGYLRERCCQPAELHQRVQNGFVVLSIIAALANALASVAAPLPVTISGATAFGDVSDIT